jgi:hypothetical protein
MALEGGGANGFRNLAGVCFGMKDGEKAVTCRVSSEALEDVESAHHASLDYVAAFEAHRIEIEDAAHRNYEAGIVGPDGMVLVRSADLRQRSA